MSYNSVLDFPNLKKYVVEKSTSENKNKSDFCKQL